VHQKVRPYYNTTYVRNYSPKTRENQKSRSRSRSATKEAQTAITTSQEVVLDEKTVKQANLIAQRGGIEPFATDLPAEQIKMMTLAHKNYDRPLPKRKEKRAAGDYRRMDMPKCWQENIDDPLVYSIGFQKKSDVMQKVKVPQYWIVGNEVYGFSP